MAIPTEMRRMAEELQKQVLLKTRASAAYGPIQRQLIEEMGVHPSSMPGIGAAAGTTAGAVAGKEVAPAGAGGVLGGAKQFLKTGKVGTRMGGVLAGLLAGIVISKLVSTTAKFGEISLQGEAIAKQRELLDPNAMFAQAILPSLQTTRQQAQEALLSELTGLPPQALAPGERMIGG